MNFESCPRCEGSRLVRDGETWECGCRLYEIRVPLTQAERQAGFVPLDGDAWIDEVWALSANRAAVRHVEREEPTDRGEGERVVFVRRPGQPWSRKTVTVELVWDYSIDDDDDDDDDDDEERVEVEQDEDDEEVES
jgi:hypothetical protein